MTVRSDGGRVLLRTRLPVLAGAAAAVLAVVALPVQQAQAAQASAPKGYQIVESFQYTAPPMTQTHGVVTCPGQKQPSGGGVFNESGGFPSAINSSYPSGQSWDVDVNNPTSTSGGFIVFAVCLGHNASYTVVASSTTAANGAQTGAAVKCPSLTKVTGGGAFSSSASTAVNLNDSYPSRNGWHVDMNNTSGANSSLTVYAVCRPRPGNYSVQTTGPIDNPAGAQTTATTSCPGGPNNVALGGGAFSSSVSTSVQLNSSFSNGSGGWTAFEQNLSSGDVSVTGYAICAGT